MKVININNHYQAPLTVDSTHITVDSATGVTCDQTFIIDNNRLFIEIIPREYVDQVSITFYNELKQTTNTEVCFVTSSNGYMTIPFSYNKFEEGDSFEITVRKVIDGNGPIIYRSKGYCTMQDDLENYRLNLPTQNNRIIEI